MIVARAKEFQKKPGLIRVINRLMSTGLYRANLSYDKLISQARKKALQPDLNDFWDEPLRKLLLSMEQEADLSSIGSFMMKQRFTNLLVGRLNAEFWFKRHPEILENPVYPAWVIAGLQRTGTTKLQRLFQADPGNRSVLGWEALNPAPMRENWKTKDGRPGIGKMSQNALKTISPTFFAIHPVEYEAPEEDILLLDFSFMSTTAEATMNIPSFASWLEQVDNSPAYDYELKLLKLLQWQKPAKRWILKSPHHLEFLPILRKNYPGVRFLWTHRNIEECVPSFVSMMAHSWSMFSDNVKMKDVKEHWVRKINYMLEQAINYRKTDNESFTDIFYTDLIKDSSEVLIHQVYGEMPEDESRRISEIEQMNPKSKYGRHEYSLEDVELDQGEIQNTYKRYIDFYNEIKLKHEQQKVGR